jgi:ketosteroid isomerase-like protein
MSQENVETLRRIYASWEGGDFTLGLSTFERNVTLVIDPATLDGGVFVGVEGVRRYMTRFLDAWESLTIAAESFKDVGDTVVVEVKQTGIGQDSRVPVDTTYFQLWTFRGDRVIRLETILSEAEALEAAGLRE